MARLGFTELTLSIDHLSFEANFYDDAFQKRLMIFDPVDPEAKRKIIAVTTGKNLMECKEKAFYKIRRWIQNTPQAQNSKDLDLPKFSGPL